MLLGSVFRIFEYTFKLTEPVDSVHGAFEDALQMISKS